MKIITNEDNKHLSDLTSGLIKKTHEIITSNSSQFLSGTPLKCTYFNIDRRKSSYGYGNKDLNHYYNGSILYKKINNFLIHFITDQMTPTEESDNEMDWILSEESFDAYIIPDTKVRPNEGDRITFDFDDNRTLFYISKFVPDTTLLSRPVIRVTISRDPEVFAKRNEKDMPIKMSYQGFYDLDLLSGEYEFRYEFIGTEYSSVIESTILKTLIKLQKIRNELNDQYIDIFYNNMYDTLISFEDENKAFIFPYITDLQKEFKLLKMNDNQLILNHLTLISIKYKQNYKVSNIRKFFRQNTLDIGEIVYNTSIYGNDRLYSPINNTIQQFSVVNIVKNKKEDDIVMEFSDTVQSILNEYSTNQMTVESLFTLENYELNFSFDELLGVFIMLYLIDIFIKKTLDRISSEEFY